MTRILSSSLSACVTAVFKTLGILTALCLIVFVSVSGVWIGDRSPPINIMNETRVIGGGFRPGETFLIETQIDRLRSCRVKIERFLMDGQQVRHLLPDYDFEAIAKDQLGPGFLRLEVPIPAGAAPGTGRYRSTLSYFCNPLQALAWPIVVEGADVAVTITREAGFSPPPPRPQVEPQWDQSRDPPQRARP